MTELMIVLAIIVAVIAMIWYLRSPRAQTAAKPKSDEVRGIQGNAGASARWSPRRLRHGPRPRRAGRPPVSPD